ncbi:NAD-dependent epimerase/dehydratase family protein [Jiangella endophytica]|uniref:NAD-dependent epimerase/dehydratase family protein n=1 Tax=Jiangella endophytica TaxID=1623398 RepID=UPI0013002DA8|nr:NAD(P)-dependent oxidoreductase [Jiangella endophytica]
MTEQRSVLVTGGAGTIGSGFASWAADAYDLTLVDLPGRFSDRHADLGRIVEADLTDLAAVKEALAGIDTVVHLGGERSPSALWSQLLPANIVGTYNVVAAAVAAGCRRVVYASSVHAVSGYPAGTQVRETDPVRPGDLYGVSKCFGEALGSFAAGTEGLSFVALRIGAFREPAELEEPDSGWKLRDFCAPADLYRLMRRVIDAEGIGFEIYNAVSGNAFTRLPMHKASHDLGFEPEYDAFELATPFRDAVHSVGGLDDKIPLSGLRDDVAAPQPTPRR